MLLLWSLQKANKSGLRIPGLRPGPIVLYDAREHFVVSALFDAPIVNALTQWELST